MVFCWEQNHVDDKNMLKNIRQVKNCKKYFLNLLFLEGQKKKISQNTSHTTKSDITQVRLQSGLKSVTHNINGKEKR